MPLPTRAEIEAAAELVHSVVTPTAQICWPLLSARAGAEVWVKHENHAPTGAFKVRGGLVFMEQLRRRADVAGVIAATRGNHGQSVAFAAARAGLKTVIVIPHGNSPDKNAAMRAFGAELVEHGKDFQEAFEYSRELAAERRLTFVPSYDPLLVSGVASYALEFFSQVPDLETIYVPIGLGSGICGVIAARNALGLKTKVVGVVSEAAPAYALSFERREPVSTNSADTLADGIACRVPLAAALEEILKGADRIVAVSDEAVLAAMAYYFSDTHNIAEGAGAAPLAALLTEKAQLAGKKVGLVLSGGNVDQALLLRALQSV